MAPNESSHVSMLSGESIDRGGSAEIPFLESEEAYNLSQEDDRLKQKIRYLRFIVRFAATILAIATVCQESRTLAKYIATRHIQRGNPPRGPWALETKLWPSIMLTTISACTVLTGLLIMSAYVSSIKRANQIALVQTWFVSLIEASHIIVWIVVGVLYRVGKTGKDLWGWACSPIAKQIQPRFEGVVNFNDVCWRGSSQWHLTIASACLQLLTGCIFVLMWQRRKVKKVMEKHGMIVKS